MKKISGILLAAAVVVSLGVMTASLAVADVSNISVAPNPCTANVSANATYTIIATIGKDLAKNEYIIIDFPAGTNITRVRVGNVTVDASAVNATVVVFQRLYINLNVACLKGIKTIVVNAVGNPNKAGAYTLNVSTSQEPTLVESASYTICPGTATSILISPQEATIPAGSTQTYTAVSCDAFNNTVADVTATTNFTISGSGGTWGTPPNTNVLTAKVVGTYYSVTGNNTPLGFTNEASLNITPGAVNTLAMVVDVSGPYTAGVAITPAVTVNATDAYNNLIPNLPITASLVVEEGEGTLHGTLTQETDDYGIATFDDLWINLEGEYKLVFTATGKTVESATFNITGAATAQLLIRPQTASITAGDSQEYEADLADEFGNVVTPDVTASVNFKIDAASNGTFTTNVLHDAVFAGTWEVTGTYIPDTDITGNTTLTVKPAAAVDFDISPKMARVTKGEKQTYTATAKDKFGNTLAVTAQTVFEIEPEAGGVWEDNVYTSDSVGEWTVTGTYAGLEDGATLEVDFALCFIATAAYGTPMAEEIQILREFRDEYLLTNPLGRALVDLYYRVSPPIAQFIAEHPALQLAVRAMLVPALAMSTVAVNTTLATPITILSLVLAAIAVAAWASRRRERRDSTYA